MMSEYPKVSLASVLTGSWERDDDEPTHKVVPLDTLVVDDPPTAEQVRAMLRLLSRRDGLWIEKVDGEWPEAQVRLLAAAMYDWDAGPGALHVDSRIREWYGDARLVLNALAADERSEP